MLIFFWLSFRVALGFFSFFAGFKFANFQAPSFFQLFYLFLVFPIGNCFIAPASFSCSLKIFPSRISQHLPPFSLFVISFIHTFFFFVQMFPAQISLFLVHSSGLTFLYYQFFNASCYLLFKLLPTAVKATSDALVQFAFLYVLSLIIFHKNFVKSIN